MCESITDAAVTFEEIMLHKKKPLLSCSSLKLAIQFITFQPDMGRGVQIMINTAQPFLRQYMYDF